MKELIEAFEAYQKLLSDELDDVCGIAQVHGWTSSRFDEGVVLRAKIAELKESLISDETDKVAFADWCIKEGWSYLEDHTYYNYFTAVNKNTISELYELYISKK